MRLVSRSLLLCVLGVVLGGFSQAFVAVAAESHGEEALQGGSLLGAPLVVSSADQLLLGGEQTQAARDAKRSNPVAVAARQASRTNFEDLDPAHAASAARAAFPTLIEHPVSGAPDLPAGQRIVRYATDNAAQISLPGDGIGVIESLEPIAARTSHGRHAPLDLRFKEAGGSFQPVLSDVGVDVPKDLSNGVSLSGTGVSLTPVDGHGSALAASEGALDGSAVLWDDAGGAAGVHDLATLAKASPEGVDLTSILLSQRSPGTLYFRVGMPSGAHLERAGDGSVRVVKDGVTLAVVSPVSAQDAEGTSVPVSMDIHGDVLVVTVDLSGDYLYPIAVDPEVNDGQLAKTSSGKRSNWEFHTSNTSKFGESAVYEGVGKEHLETKGIAAYTSGEWAYWGYQTKGVSKIYEFSAETEGKNKGDKIESFLELQAHGSGSQENKEMLSNEFENPEYTRRPASPICPKNSKGEQECLPTAGGAGNAIHFQQSATGSGSSFSDTLYQGIVSLSEPAGTHSTTSFNTTSSELEFENESKEKVKRVNVLHGSGSWLTKSIGALEAIAKDPGIGVAATKLEYESSAGKWEQLSEHNYLEKENACQGVQCYETHGEVSTLNPKLPDGEDKVRYKAEEAMSGTQSLETEGKATVKVDTAPPHAIELEGLPYGNELSERPYELTATATDGEGTTVASSGIKSIALYIDGHEFGAAAGSCSVAKGACTGSAKWTVNGAELGAGKHAIEIVALDNAGNEGRLYQPLSIRHSTPVALGPGSVDLESGDFSLGASDVSLGSGLTLGRNYSSRAANAAASNSPFGPQWNLSLGSTESLAELVDGSVLMTAGNGSQTIFANLGEGKFESPPGDSNLELSLEENKETKQKLAYYLKDAANHTSVKFTLPTNGSVWVPTKQEGTVATDTVTYSYRTSEQYIEYPLPAESRPHGIVTGPDGNLWFTEGNSNKIGKLTTKGTLTEYSLGGKIDPTSITAGPDGNLWFVTPFRILKMSTAGKVVGETITSANPGEIAAGPDGNMWFTEPSANKIGKKITAGEGGISEYSVPTGSQPEGIAPGPDGNVWFTDYHSNKIGKITPSGTVTEYSLPASSGPWGIAPGADGNMWFTDLQSKMVGKITTTGTVTEYALPAGTEVGGSIVAGSDGNQWFFTGSGPGKSGVARITRSGTVTQYALPKETSPDGLAAGPDGNLWFTGNFSEKIGTVPVLGGTVEPTEELAPKPAGVSCEPELKPGCRALKFTYATETTAKGESSSEWGEFMTRLTKVYLDAYDPSSKSMREMLVAEYFYDKQGRLRAVSAWNKANLKTTYGYDEENHVTALTAPGQESWAFTYGAIAGDLGTGRLLKATQAPASAGLWKGEPVERTEAPKITGVPVVGFSLAVSNGKWSGNPTAYGYQWEDCNSSGGACKPIPGATNENYTPQSGDVGDTIVAKVQATNGGGSVAVTSSATSVVLATATPEFTEYALPANSGPVGIGAGPDGNVWYTTVTSEKVGKITPSGTVTEYGAGSNKPESITRGPDGNLWFTAHGTNKIGKVTTAGTLTEYALPAGSLPDLITAGPDGNLWFTDYGTSKVGKITTSGSITEYGLPAGSRPDGITVGPDGNLWYTARGTNKIGKITVSGGSITEYALPASSSPIGIVKGPDGNLWFTDDGTNKIGKITLSGSITEYALPAGSRPWGIAAGLDGNLWYADFGSSKVGRITTSGTIVEYALPAGSSPVEIAVGPDGSLWFAEYGTSKIGKIGPAGGEYHAPQPGLTIDYNVPLTGGGAPYSMSGSEVAKWGQKDDPVEATAIFAPDEPQSWPASGYKRATVYYLDEQGRQVNVASPSTSPYGAIATTEYNEFNDVVRTLSPGNRQAALEAGSEKSVEVSKLLDTQSTYNGEGAKEGEVEEPGTRLIETLGPRHQVKYVAGKEQKESLARGHTKFFYDEGAPGGEKYDLVTKTSSLAQLANEEEVEVRKTTTSYSGQSNLGWKLRAPTSVTSDPEGKKITHTTLYNPATAQITETRGPAGSGGESAHDVRTIYYGAEANTEGFAACGGHPEWAGLVCETLPAKQPGGGVAPKLPVTTVTYNIWNEPLVTTETFGSVVRTNTRAYEGSRLSSSETTSSAGTPLPKVTNEYNPTSGLLEQQRTTVEGKTKTVTSKYNTLGQRTEYVDADGNAAKYKYGGLENDGLLEEMSDGSSGGAGKQTYSYNATTKLMESLTDSSAGTFTASYDVEGKLTSEVYPNGMCANDTYNSIGEATHIEYIKTSNCAEHEPGVWYSETRSPSMRGETLSRTSTLANESYAYDTLGRLIEAQETPAGEGCTTRLYAYDEESNRTSQTTRVPGGEGKCAAEGGTVEKHTYDEANRLTDAGIAYDSFGNVTKLPAADAEGHELVSTFYVDGAVATQSQNGVSSSYYLDPEGRVRETVSGANTTISHYDSTGEAVAWTSEGEGKSKRDIPGIDGTLAATQTNSETPVMQLHDLQGDVVATIGDKTGETKLLSTYNSTEFGVPNAGKAPPTFAWLGAGDIASSLPSGVITYGATSYVPQTGRALQSEQVEPPGLPEGSGAGAPYTMQEEPWNMQGAAREAAEAPGLEAAREQAAIEAAMRAALAGEGIDPEGYLTRGQANWGANKLKVDAEGEQAYTDATLVLGLMDDAIEWVGGQLVDQFVGTAKIIDWTHKFGAKLSGCSKAIVFSYCRVHWKLRHVEIPTPFGNIKLFEFPDYDYIPEVEECSSNIAGPLQVCMRIPHK